MVAVIECERPHLISNVSKMCQTARQKINGVDWGFVPRHKHTDWGKCALFSTHKQFGLWILAQSNHLIVRSYLPWLASATQNANYDFVAILFWNADSATISLPLLLGRGLCGSSKSPVYRLPGRNVGRGGRDH